VLFAVRGWPFRIPGYAPYMRMAEYLNTEGMSSEDIFAKARDLLGSGASIVIYPEGTRSPDGSLQRFHAGAFHLALATQTPILPLCIDGTGRFLKKGSLFLRPVPITVKLLQPLAPERFACCGDEAPLVLRRTVKALMLEALERFDSAEPLQTLSK
jgi:1-acyl-sn-glycerol-3-phosphate acyltransferase